MEYYKKNKYLLFSLALIFSGFLSLKSINDNLINPIQAITIFTILLYIVLSKSFNRTSNLFLKNYVLLFMLFPWISIIPAYFSHSQTPIESAHVLFNITGIFLLYFYFKRVNISQRDMLKILFIFAFIYTFIELVQQITYPTYWFAGRTESESTGKLEIRLGMYKFYMTGINLLIIPLFYSWEILLNKITRYRLYSFTFFVIGLYAFLARKMLFAFIITIVISFFIRKTIKWYYWIGLISISIVFYFNSDKIFGNYFQTTQSELNDEDFVRFKSTNYFLHYFDNSMCVFLGNGKDYEPSVYGKFISSLKESLGFYRSDIGVFAHFSYYGILGLIPIILFIIFILRKWEKIPFYIKLYFIYNLIQLPIAFPLNSVIGSFTFVIVIYLIELDFQKRLILNSQKRNEKFLKKKLLNNLDQNIKFPKLLI